MSKLDFKIGKAYQYSFLFGDVATGTLLKTRFFGMFHLIEYGSRWDVGHPTIIKTCWIGKWRAYKEF